MKILMEPKMMGLAMNLTILRKGRTMQSSVILMMGFKGLRALHHRPHRHLLLFLSLILHVSTPQKVFLQPQNLL